MPLVGPLKALLDLRRHVEESSPPEENTQSSVDEFHTSRRSWCSVDSDRRVEKLKFRLPPSALKPAATAMPSMRVDFPLPFSPMK